MEKENQELSKTEVEAYNPFPMDWLSSPLMTVTNQIILMLDLY